MKNNYNGEFGFGIVKTTIFTLVLFVVFIFCSNKVWGYTGSGTDSDPYIVNAQKGLSEILKEKGKGNSWVYIGINDTITIHDKVTAANGKFRIFAMGNDRKINRSQDVQDWVNRYREYCFQVNGGTEVVFGYNKNGYKLTLDGKKSSFVKSMYSNGMIKIFSNGKATIDEKCIVKDVTNQDTITQAGAIKSNGELTINGEIKNCEGSNGGGISCKSGRLILNDKASIHDCQSNSEGGGIYVGAGVEFFMNDAHIYNCTSEEEGGGIFATGENCIVIIYRGQIYNNHSDKTAGGVFSGYQAGLIVGNDTGGPWVYNNTADGSGGGVRCNGGTGIGAGGKTYFNWARIYNNTSGKFGGGIACGENSFVNFKHVDVFQNTSVSRGGGISITSNIKGGDYGKVTIQDCNIEDNASKTSGGGLSCYSALNIINSDINNNNALVDGGGILLADISDCLIDSYSKVENNNAIGKGGGIYISDKTTLKLKGSNIYRNTSSGVGSGVFVNGTLDMTEKAVVDGSNQVYLASNKYITVSGRLVTLTGYIACIDSENTAVGTKIVEINYGNKNGEDELYYTGNADSELRKENYTKKFYSYSEQHGKVLRPGNKIKGVTNNSIVISEKYEIEFNQNAEKLVENMPDNQIKFWNEDILISKNILVRKGYEIDSEKHWNTKKDKSGITYKPGGMFGENRNMILYAQWTEDANIIIIAKDRYYTVGQSIVLDCNEIFKKVLINNQKIYDFNGRIKITKIQNLDKNTDIFIGNQNIKDFPLEKYLTTELPQVYKVYINAVKNNKSDEKQMLVYIIDSGIDNFVTRFVSKEYLWTLSDDSKWNKELKSILQNSLNKEKGKGVYKLKYTSVDVSKIKEELSNNNYIITKSSNERVSGEW